MKRHWYIIGMRASGKSTVGRLLAQRLSLPFLDTDEEVERLARRTIADIFAAQGESVFRSLETQVLETIRHLPSAVVATGGGTILSPKNRVILQETGWVVWLHAQLDVLWDRIQADPATPVRRPPLSTGGRAELEQIYQSRMSLYQELANLAFDTTKLSPKDIVQEILLQCPMQS